MVRTLLAVLLAASVAAAQPTPPPVPPVPAPPVAPPRPELPAPPVMPGGMMMINVAKVKVKDGGIVAQETVMVPVTKLVEVEAEENGKKVKKQVPVTEMRTETRERVTKLKDVKASGADGKAIEGDDLEKKLKDGGLVVMTFGKLTEEQRKVFKDDTVFVEQTPPAPPAPPGGLPGGPLEPVRPNFPGSDPNASPTKK